MITVHGISSGYLPMVSMNRQCWKSGRVGFPLDVPVHLSSTCTCKASNFERGPPKFRIRWRGEGSHARSRSEKAIGGEEAVGRRAMTNLLASHITRSQLRFETASFLDNCTSHQDQGRTVRIQEFRKLSVKKGPASGSIRSNAPIRSRMTCSVEVQRHGT